MWSKTDVPSESSLGDYALLGKPLELANTSVTALDFAPMIVDNGRILAAGFESGVVKIYKFEVDGWSLIKELDNK